MSERPSVIVGVTPSQPHHVVEQALVFARRFDAGIVCVQVDSARFVVDGGDEGVVLAAPFDPDGGDVIEEHFDPEVVARVAPLAEAAGVECRFIATAGDPARMLGQIAESENGILIVVGSRRASFGSSLREFFTGSVAAGLAHRQRRPVIVVPLDPVSPETPLPWDESR